MHTLVNNITLEELSNFQTLQPYNNIKLKRNDTIRKRN